jgi:heme-degrading monooxygenase HmoA
MSDRPSEEHRHAAVIAVIEFALNDGIEAEFQAKLAVMLDRVRGFDGFLGEEPCRSLADPGTFVTVSYWRDEAALAAWRDDPVHREVQVLGREKFFRWYRIRVSRTVREYGVGRRS